ncbi:Alpha-glucosiduronase [Candidatus Koribacter versatilis Ellin345]|uniref:Xylan alpha-1,2-glucuronidase n=1 Tax=Koribacter versatilis (strain Ellin345) TaxID=204669 RepID=Q1IT34_KORVE|nr:alpha-glucuronidase family glycosyl hydrolase [Candidatus Koribacter versatilis]ABF39966.1 Alpha-glucosiduronase [Candidatus Koribacter versatilis Ellin345]
MGTRLIWLFLMWCIAICAIAEDGHDAWLRYARLHEATAKQFQSLPKLVVTLGDSPPIGSAQTELKRGLARMLGREIRASKQTPTQDFILLGVRDQIEEMFANLHVPELAPDGFWLDWTEVGGHKALVIAGGSDRGPLYGTFALLGKIARGENLETLDEVQNPAAPLRWINQWDNLDGTIERGYAGPSIFFENGSVRADLTRAREYARLLASVGLNGCVVNNVNADPRILDDAFIPQLARIADAFRPYGVKLGVSVNLSMPKTVGGLDTFDPLDPRVQAWWAHKFDALYRAIPDFGGVVVKADSEGQLGPSAYGRTPVDAANVIARALRPHHGVVFYRAFVYNHHLDWKDPKADRARAAYDIFHPLDGRFDDNVIVQIKNGPIDFQVREPASPLFGGVKQTSKAIELQITQEYLGQQRHTVYLAPMWKQTLDFDMHVDGHDTPVKSLLRGVVGVANVGMDANWLANHLAMANLYSFGRLAWDSNLSAEAIVDEWMRLTFGNDPEVVQKVREIQMESWPAYEHYTGPLGLQTLTNITGPHYGPAPESQERNGWGQWIRAEHDGVGMDRSVSTGTGFVGQYSAEAQKQFETAAATPDELLLFFHHVPYTYKLHGGKTVIQAIYDFHYEGAAQANEFVNTWETLERKIDPDRYQAVLAQLSYQADHAIVWRDAINDWCLRTSGISDAQDRVGHHPDRIEAESMHLEGYTAVELTSWEGASGGKAVACPKERTSCAVETSINTDGTYDIAVQYFDLNGGVARFELFVNDQRVATWKADRQLPGKDLSADSSVREHINGISMNRGDHLRIVGTPNGGDPAAIDYIEIQPHAN